MRRVMFVGLLLTVSTIAQARPVGSPLCFVDAAYGATWKLETQDVGGSQHWLVVGQLQRPGLTYPQAVYGSGVTRANGSAGMTVKTYLGGASATVNINLNSAAVWWPNANAHFYLYYPGDEFHEGEGYGVYFAYLPNVALTKVACP